MRIECGNFVVYADTWSVWIKRKVKPKEGRKEYEMLVSGYYDTLEDALNDYIRRSNEEDAKTVSEMLKAVQSREMDAIGVVHSVIESELIRKERIRKKGAGK